MTDLDESLEILVESPVEVRAMVERSASVPTAQLHAMLAVTPAAEPVAAPERTTERRRWWTAFARPPKAYPRRLSTSMERAAMEREMYRL